MSSLKKITILTGDAIILYLSLLITLFLRYGPENLGSYLKDHFLPFSLIFFVWVFFFYVYDLYRLKGFRGKNALIKSIVAGTFWSVIVSVLIFYLFGEFFRLTPKTNLLIFAIVFSTLCFLSRLSLLRFFSSGKIGITFLGNSPLIEETIGFLKNNPHLGYSIVNWLKENELENANKTIEEIKTKQTQLIIFVQPNLTRELATKLVNEFLPSEVKFVNFWDFYETIFEKVPLEEIKESWFIENITNKRPLYDLLKRILDIFLGFFILMIFLPFLIIFSLIIKLTSSGPAIYSQERIGKNGKKITIYKFRTMFKNAEGPLWTKSNDERITFFGKILRFSHLDELPQLINIIRGDISFTGPRPERVEIAEQFRKFPYYDLRHIIKPGLSGWAQINYKPSASLEEGYEKLRYDIYYIKNRSFFLDLKIIFKTIKYFTNSHW